MCRLDLEVGIGFALSPCFTLANSHAEFSVDLVDQ